MGLTWRAILLALGTATELARSAKTLRDSVEDLQGRRKAEPPYRPALEGNLYADEWRSRVERLESNEARQAELVTKMAEQNQALSNGLQLLATRMEKVYWMAFAALGLAILLALAGLYWIFLR